MALKTTILEMRERDRDRREAVLDRPLMVENWRHDIGEVYDVIRAALKPYVDEGSTVIDVEDVDVTDDDLGRNTYPQLVIEIVGCRIMVTPVARFTIGGTGRIDMYRENRPTEDHRVFIVRDGVGPEHDPGSWFIEQKGEVASSPTGPLSHVVRGKRRYHNLEPASIESAAEYLLKMP